MRRSRKYGDQMCGIRWTGARRMVCSIGAAVLSYCGSSHTSSNGAPLKMCPDGLPKIGVSHRPAYTCPQKNAAIFLPSAFMCLSHSTGSCAPISITTSSSCVTSAGFTSGMSRPSSSRPAGSALASPPFRKQTGRHDPSVEHHREERDVLVYAVFPDRLRRAQTARCRPPAVVAVPPEAASLMSVTGWFPLRRRASGHRVERLAWKRRAVDRHGCMCAPRRANRATGFARAAAGFRRVVGYAWHGVRVGQAAPATVCGDCGTETTGFGGT